MRAAFRERFFQVERYPYIQEFLRFYQDQRSAPVNTVSAYEHAIKKFWDFVIANFGFNNPKRVEKTHFFKYKEHLQNASYSSNSMTLWLNTIRFYFAYLDEMGIVEGNKFPNVVITTGAPMIPHYVPTVAEIFKIRFKRRIRLRKAACFELVLSTGMRSDEMRALRICDFQFDTPPMDIETGKPSIYYTGSIHLQPRKHRGKTMTSRRLYFSALAARLLKRYITHHHLDPQSHVPFHPWARQNFQNWVAELGEGVVAPFESQEEAEAGKVIQRDFSYRDVNVEALDIDPRMRRLIKSRQDTADALPDYKQKGLKLDKRKRKRLHPHSLRHFWICMTHYRNAFGERRAEDRLRIMAGHTSGSETTRGYLRDLDLVRTDEIWKRLCLGKPTDWMGIDDD